MVYNFALPPLVLHTFYREDATAIAKWAANLKPPSETTTFFNILDTHDGIGLMGVKGILAQKDIDILTEKARERGAYISYKMTEDFNREPYEINSSWWSAINEDMADEDIGLQVRRYLASRSLALVLQGVPGLYIHGALASPNDHELVKQTGINRDVNRGMINRRAVAATLGNPDEKASMLLEMTPKLNLTRTRQRAFHPNGEQRILMVSPSVFVVLRTSPERDQHILAMTNVTPKPCTIEIPLSDLPLETARWYDLLKKKEWKAEKNKLYITLEPYDVVWLKPHFEMEMEK